MSELYHDGNRRLQDQFETRKLADRIEERIVSPTIREGDREFIERMDMFFLATADDHAKPQCSYKGGDPGFVRVLDEHTIAFPSYDGNGMFMSLGNLERNPQVGLLFVDFLNQWRLRLNGVATVEPNDPLVAAYPEAQLVVRIKVSEVFGNCPRYVHKMQLVERSRFVPHEACQTPVPEWKRDDWASDVLPPNDPARGG